MMSERDYAENGTDPVVTLTAADPEERMVYWSLLPAIDTADDCRWRNGDDFVADADEFMITPSADGASASLSFKFPPDYEAEGGRTNTYKVVVVAADDAPGAAVDNNVDIRKKTYHKLTVMVTDEDEDGSISLSALQPQVERWLTATLTDPDSRSTAAASHCQRNVEVGAVLSDGVALGVLFPAQAPKIWTPLKPLKRVTLHTCCGHRRHVPPGDRHLHRQARR